MKLLSLSKFTYNASCIFFLILHPISSFMFASTPIQLSQHQSKHSLRQEVVTMNANEQRPIEIRVALNNDIPRVATFLGQFWYSMELSKSQRLEFIRIEKNDLIKRYGEQVGQRKQPATLLVAYEDEEILGCVGLDCQRLNLTQKKFSAIRGNFRPSFDDSDEVEPEIIAVVLANLVIRKDRRKQGLGKILLKACEDTVKSWGYEDIYLNVDSQNIAAQKLYTGQGFKLEFIDKDATCVMPGVYGLQTDTCTNYCYRKRLSSSPSSSGGNNAFAALADKFKSFFNSK